MSTIANLKANLVALKTKRDNHQRTHNDGGHGYNPYDAQIQTALDELHAAEDADLIASWPEIQARWNAAVAKYTGPQGVNMADLKNIEREAGITHAQVKSIKTKVEG